MRFETAAMAMVLAAGFDGNWVEKSSGVERRRDSKMNPYRYYSGKVEADLHATLSHRLHQMRPGLIYN